MLGATLLVLGTVAAACDGDELTLEEYFGQVETLEDEAQIEAVVFPEEQEFASEEEQIEAVRDFFERSGAIIRDFVDGLDDIDPPAEVESVHNEALDAGRDVVELFEDAADQIAEAESAVEAEAVAEAADPDAEVAFERFDAACLSLQGIADDKGIDVDLCE